MDLELAKQQIKEAVAKGDWLTVSRIIGAPLDPRKPNPDIVSAICEIQEPADPTEYLFYFDVDEDVKEVYTLTNTGTITCQTITPGTPSAVPFANFMSKCYSVHIVDLMNAKFDIIGKKKVAVGRSLDAKEIKKVLDLALTGTPGANQLAPDSGDTFFTYAKLLEMRKLIGDYSDDFVLIVGADVDQEILLWDYNENKYHSLKEALADLRIEIIKVSGTLKLDGGAEEAIFAANKALLVGRSSVVGRPISFGRKLIASVSMLGGEVDEAKQRIVIVQPALCRDGEAPKVSTWGMEQFNAVVINSKALASYEK